MPLSPAPWPTFEFLSSVSFMVNIRDKFDVSTLNRYRYIEKVPKF